MTMAKNHMIFQKYMPFPMIRRNGAGMSKTAIGTSCAKHEHEDHRNERNQHHDLVGISR